MHSTLRPLFLILGLVALLAACSTPAATTAPSVAAPSVAPSEAPSEAPASEAPASEAPSAAADATIALATNALGEIIVDAEGKTVYAFTPDTAGESTCYDDCAAQWPPLLATDAAAISAGAGLDATKLTTVDRTDGDQAGQVRRLAAVLLRGRLRGRRHQRPGPRHEVVRRGQRGRADRPVTHTPAT